MRWPPPRNRHHRTRMSYRNGYLPDSALAPIPGGRLAKEPAAAWNAMIEEAKTRGLAVPVPDGPASSYRTFDQQVQLKAYWTAQGKPDNAATPGTSNHGWGTAVDCAEDAAHHAATIDAIGEPYGWSKKWSDAPWESWHNHYKSGVWAPRVFTPNYRLGNKGPMVLLFTHRLVKLGYLERRWWHFNAVTYTAVKRFQRDHHFTPDGVVGPVTWSAIKRFAIAIKRKQPSPKPVKRPKRKPKPKPNGTVPRPPATRISTAAVDAIAGFEGGESTDGLFRPYQDSVGVWTIGYGHTEGVSHSSRPLTKDQALALLNADLDRTYVPEILSAARTYKWLPLTQNQLDALASFCFNLGSGYFAPAHSLGAALQKHDLPAAAAAILLYDKAGGQALAGLTRRRRWEHDLFLKHQGAR